MRRTCLSIMVFAILGVAVNVGVAWWLASRPYQLIFTRPGDRYGTFHLQEWREDIPIGQEVYAVAGYLRVSEYHDLPGLQFVSCLLDRDEFVSRLPRGSRLLTRSPVLDYEKSSQMRSMTRYEEHFAGWPCLALFGSELGGWDDVIHQSAGRLPLPKSCHAERSADWVPCQPIWPGFIGNTAFYAAGLWLATLGPLRARRRMRSWRRHRRGECTACGYDRRGTPAGCVCPECGTSPNERPG